MRPITGRSTSDPRYVLTKAVALNERKADEVRFADNLPVIRIFSCIKVAGE